MPRSASHCSHCVLSSVVVFLCSVCACVAQAAPQCSAPAGGAPVYTVSAATGSPVDVTHLSSFVFPNDSTWVLRLRDINPYAFKCSVSTSVQQYQETAISGFLGIIGGVANVGGGVAVPEKQPGETPGQPPPPPPTTEATKAASLCESLWNQRQREVQSMLTRANTIEGSLQNAAQAENAAVDAFNQGLSNLRSQNNCSATVNAATGLAKGASPNIAQVFGALGESVPVGRAIDELAIQSQALLTTLSSGIEACSQKFRQQIDEDSAFLNALVSGTSAAPSAVDNWRTALQQIKATDSALANARAGVNAILANPQNFTIDTSIHGHQQNVTATITCSPVPLAQVSSAAYSSPASGAASSAAGNPAAPAGNTWSRDFHFGPGPRFVLAGGIVISPLPQNIFSTSANPAASSGSSIPANIVIQQEKSSTRILPIGMLHARFWDQLPPSRRWDWIPNYISAGVTAKSSDNKGTNIEYLFGPSWSFAERQLFLTAGVYAGQQQRLAGGLNLGDATSLSSANLPISQTTVWKAGFAITWAPAGK